MNLPGAAVVSSHICTTKCNKQRGHEHTAKPDECEHNGCGRGSNFSPLQAFLTDNLKGFHVAQQSDPDSPHHLHNHPPGSMCHVKMGFNSKNLRQNSAKGAHIYIILQPFCGGFNTPLRQLSEKLGCLTKRTPRLLGDLFGFTWHLNGQLFKTERPTPQTLAKKLVDAIGDNSPKLPRFLLELLKDVAGSLSSPGPTATVLSLSLEAMAPAIPFLYQLFMAKDPNTLPGALFDLAQHCHKSNAGDSGIGAPIVHGSDVPYYIPKHQCSTSPADLWSLYYPVSAAPSSVGTTDTHAVCRKANCGGYLYPLTHTFGSIFAPMHASSYLSWFLHLTDDLDAGLRNMLETFKGLKCTGCSNCKVGSHGGTGCKCPSIVDCVDVMPLLYENGFQFYDARWLKGWKYESGRWSRDNPTVRSCAKFSQQLSNVLSPDAPLAKLLEAIDSFLYLFRFYFFYNLSSFWLCTLAILLYFIVYGIDVLHLQSHVHLSSSHTMPLLNSFGFLCVVLWLPCSAGGRPRASRPAGDGESRRCRRQGGSPCQGLHLSLL
ncbi:variant erythrocyte surface antigen-1 family protein [Babesia caballi]|uniref:Variant erythrocyte surface antigen-1 family protein n=1 Tax=Babesia caballi TaxID=5871 RepID=A0AAV4LZ27_BABCB|nr:variant erythrocyte surface antigen-1 family protein [Babesia caballi]